MNRREMIVAAVVLAAAFGVWFYRNKKSQSNEQPQDQTPATAAEQYYTAPPSVGVQQNQPGQMFVQQRQVMPLPYNT